MFWGVKVLGAAALVTMTMVGGFAAEANAANAKPAWVKVCQNKKDAKTCLIKQDLYQARKGKDGKMHTVGRMLGLKVIYANDSKKKRKPYLSVDMPLGVDLRAGAAMRVDKGKEYAVPYLRCMQTGCAASLQLNSKLLKSMKAGNDLLVGFRPWGGAKTVVVKASLKGFSRAFAQIK